MKSSENVLQEAKTWRRSSFALCPICDKAVQLLSIDDSAELFNTDSQDIEFLANSGSLHRVHNRRGDVMICSVSLYDCFENRQTRLLDSHFIVEPENAPEAVANKAGSSG